MNSPQICLVLVLIIIISSVICLTLDGQSSSTTESDNIRESDEFDPTQVNNIKLSDSPIPPETIESQEDTFDYNYYAGQEETGTLEGDFEDFIDLLPVSNLRNITIQFYRRDYEIRSIVKFTRSEEFIKIRNEIFGIPEFQDMCNYLKEIGVNFKETAKYIRKHFEMEELQGIDENITDEGLGGVNGYLEEVASIFPQTEIAYLFLEKVGSTDRFSNFVGEAKKLSYYVERLKKSSEFKIQLQKLENRGISIERIYNYVKQNIVSSYDSGSSLL